MALNITAERIALAGECKCIIFKACNAGIEVINRAGTWQSILQHHWL